MRYSLRKGREPQHSSQRTAVAETEGLAFECTVLASAEEEGHTTMNTQSAEHRALTAPNSSTSSQHDGVEQFIPQNSVKTGQQTPEPESPHTRQATMRMMTVMAESERSTSPDPMASLTSTFLSEFPQTSGIAGHPSTHGLDGYATSSASHPSQHYGEYVRAPGFMRTTPFTVAALDGYGQQVFGQTLAPFEYSSGNTRYYHWSPQAHMYSSLAANPLDDSEYMTNDSCMTAQRYPSLTSSPEPEPAHQDQYESTPPSQHASLTITPRRSLQLDTSIRPAPTLASASARRRRKNRQRNFSPSNRRPGKKPGDRNVPVWPQYPVPLTQLDSHLTLYEICQQYPNGLQWANLDAFVQRRWSPSEIVKCMPQHCQDDIYSRSCIDKTMYMTKRIQKTEAKLRETGMMEVLRGNAERGDFLREDGRPRGSWMGPSVKRPRRGWVDRQRRKDGLDEEETESDADADNDEDEQNVEVGDVEEDAEDEDAVGEIDTDYEYLASRGK